MISVSLTASNALSLTNPTLQFSLGTFFLHLPSTLSIGHLSFSLPGSITHAKNWRCLPKFIVFLVWLGHRDIRNTRGITRGCIIQNSDVAETRSTCLVVRQKDYSGSGKQRKSMFLFVAFQAHLIKIKLRIYGNSNFYWSTRGKRSLLPFSRKVFT